MALIKKGKRLYSIVYDKCPYCHEGDFFIGKRTLDFKHGNKVHERCSECNGRLILEPGFFFGAAYVTYALGVATIVATFLAIWVLFPEASSATYVITFSIILLILAPLFYRKSRIIWANLFMRYGKPRHSKKRNRPEASPQ